MSSVIGDTALKSERHVLHFRAVDSDRGERCITACAQVLLCDADWFHSSRDAIVVDMCSVVSANIKQIESGQSANDWSAESLLRLHGDLVAVVMRVSAVSYHNSAILMVSDKSSIAPKKCEVSAVTLNPMWVLPLNSPNINKLIHDQT